MTFKLYYLKVILDYPIQKTVFISKLYNTKIVKIKILCLYGAEKMHGGTRRNALLKSSSFFTYFSL